MSIMAEWQNHFIRIPGPVNNKTNEYVYEIYDQEVLYEKIQCDLPGMQGKE